MTKFHEGQEVEVAYTAALMHNSPSSGSRWRKAKIINKLRRGKSFTALIGEVFQVEFLDGTRGVFDADHIRANEKDSGLPDFALDAQQYRDRFHRKIGD